MTKSTTIRDVALRAGVSVATVSRVLNGSGGVKGELKDRVIESANELQYRPSQLARNFRRNSTNKIAIVVPDIQNPFFTSILRGLESRVFSEKYMVVVCNTDDDPKRESVYLQTLADESVAGIVICATDEHRGSKELSRLLDRQISLVALDRRLLNAPIDGVLSDNYSGSYEAISYLITQGHNRIGLIAGPSKYAPARERQLGYEQALVHHGLPVEPQLIKMTNFKSTEAEVSTKELLDLSCPPTAIFLSSGNVAIGSLRTIHRQRLRIPDDISLIMFDDLDWAEAFNPGLTAISQNTQGLGSLAGELLLNRIRGEKKPPQEWRLPTKLVIRNSVKPLQPQGVIEQEE